MSKELSSLMEQLAGTLPFAAGQAVMQKRIEELEATLVSRDAEIAELVAAITWYLKENDTDGFGCTCEPGRMCSPCQTNMRQQVLRAALAKVRKP